ncbi:MAG: hypothetical protein AAFO04_17005 [Cyanobacteria bacterium J06592_8]
MNNIQRKISIFTGTIIGILLTTSAGIAQIAEVPSPNADGDFMSAKVLGNRGYYNNQIWLVVDLEYLNCRYTPGGEVKTRLITGATMTAIFPQEGREDAIVIRNGKPWLRVRSLNPNLSRIDSGVCYVRANKKYIFPINNDYIEDLY